MPDVTHMPTPRIPAAPRNSVFPMVVRVFLSAFCHTSPFAAWIAQGQAEYFAGVRPTLRSAPASDATMGLPGRIPLLRTDSGAFSRSRRSLVVTPLAIGLHRSLAPFSAEPRADLSRAQVPPAMLGARAVFLALVTPRRGVDDRMFSGCRCHLTSRYRIPVQGRSSQKLMVPAELAADAFVNWKTEDDAIEPESRVLIEPPAV